jgi:hypothetical protein
MSSLQVILFGVVKQFCRFWIWSETECKTLAEYGLQHNSTPPHHPPQPHTVCIYTVHLVWEGGRGEVREKVEGQQCTSITPWSMGAGQQFTSWVANTNHEWMCLQSIKSVQHNAAKSVNRASLKKSRHIGFGVFYSSFVHGEGPGGRGEGGVGREGPLGILPFHSGQLGTRNEQPEMEESKVI